MSHKDYTNISHKYYGGWNEHTEIKSPNYNGDISTLFQGHCQTMSMKC